MSNLPSFSRLQHAPIDCSWDEVRDTEPGLTSQILRLMTAGSTGAPTGGMPQVVRDSEIILIEYAGQHTSATLQYDTMSTQDSPDGHLDVSWGVYQPNASHFALPNTVGQGVDAITIDKIGIQGPQWTFISNQTVRMRFSVAISQASLTYRTRRSAVQWIVEAATALATTNRMLLMVELLQRTVQARPDNGKTSVPLPAQRLIDRLRTELQTAVDDHTHTTHHTQD